LSLEFFSLTNLQGCPLNGVTCISSECKEISNNREFDLLGINENKLTKKSHKKY
jgi:hypothetical protein